MISRIWKYYYSALHNPVCTIEDDCYIDLVRFQRSTAENLSYNPPLSRWAVENALDKVNNDLRMAASHEALTNTSGNTSLVNFTWLLRRFATFCLFSVLLSQFAWLWTLWVFITQLMDVCFITFHHSYFHRSHIGFYVHSRKLYSIGYRF